ncbi:MAG: hypothetical protein KJ771_03330 [Nanoarchaeota archaeon]|nr:hypothetical protein [Nanoarchaeota archaeon]
MGNVKIKQITTKNMEGIFTLPYSEYEAISQIQKKLKKSEGYSCYIPTSRQQKGVDFIIHSSNTNKFLRIQVKSSRSYTQKPKQLKSGKSSTVKYKNYLWFNNFIDKYEKDNADYYLLFGLFPIYNQKSNIKSKTDHWDSVVICVSEKKMFNILKNVKTKKEKKKDRFFDIAFNEKNKIFGIRGFPSETDLSEFLLSNMTDELKKKLK